jgi:hypothetical protein
MAAPWNNPLNLAEMMPRHHHYLFAHRALYACACEEPQKTITLLSSDDAQDFLEGLWTHVGEQLPDEDRLTFEGLSSRVARLDEKHMVALVTMPEPQGTTEAHFVAIIFTPPQRSLFGRKKTDLRYITLERGMELSGESRTVLCEWRDDSHLNYGNGPEATEVAFLEVVQGMVNRQ